MGMDAIGTSYQDQAMVPAATAGKGEKPDDGAEINRLNAEIEQAESEVKETAKEVQKAMSDSSGGSSEKVQLLQNKMQMQQQSILMTQMKIKEIESPSKSTAEKTAASTPAKPRVDQYIAAESAASSSDNVYRLEEKNGTRTIVFNRADSRQDDGSETKEAQSALSEE